ncbi:hypothetical protein [Actinomadura sp. SCN-SB]|uniref:hypothetical protein n=1 Tax=Actinomadura sp. SCN-SB TaxID=3373092 RepID=UPI003751117C
MYAWIWRRLPGRWPAKTALAAGLILVAGLVLWYAFFPWLEERIRFDHGVVQNGTPSSPAHSPGQRPTIPGG